MAYSGNVKGHLTTPTFPQPINSFRDLRDSGLKWMLADRPTDWFKDLKKHPDPVVRLMFSGRDRSLESADKTDNFYMGAGYHKHVRIINGRSC